MRKIYADDSTKKIIPVVKSFVIKREDWNAVLEDILKIQEDIVKSSDNLEDFKEKLAEAFVTRILSATDAVIDNASITELKANVIEAVGGAFGSLEADSLRVNNDGYIERLNSTFARLTDIVATTILTEEVFADKVNAATIKAEKAEIDEYDITDLHSDNASFDSLAASTARIEQADIDNSHTNLAAVDYLDVPEEATIKEAVIESLDTTRLEYEFSHNDPADYQQIDAPDVGADGDYWIVLPKFTNGTYFLLAKDEELNKVWAMEINNSTRNIWFAWSVDDTHPWIQDVELVEDATDSIEFIQIHCNAFGHSLRLFHRVDSNDTTTPPTIYSTKQFDGTKDFVISKRKGVWMPNAVFAGEFHADTMQIDDIMFDNVNINHSITLPTSYDSYDDPLAYTSGEEGQYIRNKNTGKEEPHINVQWESPADKVDYKDQLILADAVARYDGDIPVEDEDTGDITHDYNIKHLGNNTEVHGAIKIDTYIKNPHLYIGKEEDLPEDYLEDDALVLFTEVVEDSDYTANVFYRKRDIELEPTYYKLIPRSDMEDSKPVIYDQATDTIKTSDELSIDKFRANSITVEDLTVSGTAHIENTEEETVQGNFVTVRVNTNSGLATGEYAGLLVNNFKVDEICALVVDSEGVARVGHATGTETTYEDLYFDKENNKYYTDEELTTEVEPEGMLLSWTDKIESDGIIHWTDATWKKLNFDSTQAFLTREEAIDMNDQGLIKWNADTNKSDTVSLPNKSEQSLISRVSEAEANRKRYFKSEAEHWFDNTGADKDIEVSQLVLDGAEIEPVDIPDEFAVKDGVFYYHEWNDSGIEYYDWLPSDPPAGATFVTPVDLVTYKNVVEYSWKDKQAGVYHFATEADYERAAADIPVDSLIVIDEVNNYSYGEDRDE